MDSWSLPQLASMRAGGNGAMKRFLAEQKFPPGLDAAEKYGSAAVAEYRTYLREKSRGGNPEPVGFVGYTPPAERRAAAAPSPQMQGFGSGSTSHVEPPPSGGEDFFSSVSGAFLSAASYTGKVVTEASKVAAVKATEASRTAAAKISEVSNDPDVYESVRSTASTGWGAVSSFFATAANTVAEAAAGGEPERAFGLDRSRIVGSREEAEAAPAAPAAPAAGALADKAPSPSFEDELDAELRALDVKPAAVAAAPAASSSSTSAWDDDWGFGLDDDDGDAAPPPTKVNLSSRRARGGKSD